MRHRPYTARGIARVKCAKCRKRPGRFEWSAKPCALPRRAHFALCTECDVEANDELLRILDVPDRQAIMRAYRRHVTE